jgi:hypothetical protein
MVRSSRSAVAVCGLALALGVTGGTACAQQLPRLHVEALGMHADRTFARVASAIHVTIHLHVRERVDGLDGVVLPDLSNLAILGDERRLHDDATGTDYVETLTVTGLRPGVAHLTPAHLDAIDARNGRPTRFSSNDLTIRIEPETGAVRGAGWRTLLWRAFLMAFGVVAGAGVLIALIRLRLRRGREPRYAAAPPVVTALPSVEPRSVLVRALVRLRADRTRGDAVLTRAALRDFAGAGRDDTLESVLMRLDGGDAALRAALRLAERAAFVADERLQSGIDDLIPAVDRVLER